MNLKILKPKSNSCLRKIQNVIRTHTERFCGVIYYHFRVKDPVNTDVIFDMPPVAAHFQKGA